jgi:multidrug efflux pump
MLCAKLLKPEASTDACTSPASASSIGSCMLMTSAFLFMLRHSALTLALALGTVGINIYLVTIVPKGFFPQQDTGRLAGSIQTDQNTSFQAMRERLSEIVKIVRADPAVASVVAFTGGTGAGGTTPNTGRLFTTLKPLEEREVTADQVIARLRPQLATVPGATLYLQAAQDLQIGARQSNAQYQYIAPE